MSTVPASDQIVSSWNMDTTVPVFAPVSAIASSKARSSRVLVGS